MSQSRSHGRRHTSPAQLGEYRTAGGAKIQRAAKESSGHTYRVGVAIETKVLLVDDAVLAKHGCKSFFHQVAKPVLARRQENRGNNEAVPARAYKNVSRLCQFVSGIGRVVTVNRRPHSSACCALNVNPQGLNFRPIHHREGLGSQPSSGNRVRVGSD